MEKTESIRQKMSKGLKGHALVGEVLREWESIVNRVAKREVGEKMIVCGKSARWWDSEVKDKTNSRRQLYKSMLDGNVDAWEGYCKLRKEVKDLIRKKKIDIWNEVVEKVNTDYEGSRKEFWAFVSRRTKGKKKAIGSLRSDKGISVSSTRGKLQVLQKHYEALGRTSEDSDFDGEWKEEVETKVSTCMCSSLMISI